MPRGQARTVKARGAMALLAIDLFSDFTFPDGHQLCDRLRPVAPAIGALIRRARRARVPVVYVNDHGGRWHDSFADIVARAGRGRGRDIARAVAPTRRDYFVLKPRRSGFLHTPLSMLLSSLEVEHLVLTGVATDMCILSTATDAQNRELGLAVPADCCAALDDDRHRQAIGLIRDSLGADVQPSTELRLPR
jgi:nicotinamidase-related amidase